MSINKHPSVLLQLAVIILISGTVTFAQTIDYFPIGVYANGRNDPSLDGDTLFSQLQACGFNIVRVVPHHQSGADNNTEDFLTQANNKNIDLILKRLGSNNPAKLSAAQYKRYEAEMSFGDYDPNLVNYYYFNHDVGEWHEEEVNNVTIEVWKTTQDDQAGYLLKGVYDMDIGYETANSNGVMGEWDLKHETNYLVTYRMKMDSVFYGREERDTLVRIEIKGYTSNGVLMNSTSDYFTIDDFYSKGANGNYADFTIPYTLPDDENITIVHHNLYWYQAAELYVDYVEVMDSLGYDMQPSQNQVAYRDALAANIDSIPNVNDHLKRYYLVDEPRRPQYWAQKTVDGWLKDGLVVDYPRPGITAFHIPDTRTFEHYLEEAQPTELMHDRYPFRGADSTYIQTELSDFTTYLQHGYSAADVKGKPFWAIVQAHKYGSSLRDPSPEEIRAEVWLALAHGAQGVFYYTYESRYTESNNAIIPDILVDAGDPLDIRDDTHEENFPIQYTMTTRGLVERSDSSESSTEYAIKTEKWEPVQRLNKQLALIGAGMLNLNLQSVFTQGDQVPNGSVVTGITGADSIEIATFQHDISGEKYFILVNRSGFLIPLDSVTITVTLDNTGYLVEDVLSALEGDSDPLRVPYRTLGQNQNSFTVKLYAGEGRLFRIDSNAPSVPTGFNVTGSPGQHPLLIWNANPEGDMKGYKIFRKLPGGIYNNIATVYDTTRFRDMELTVGNSQFDPVVRYYIRAIDVFDQESFNSPTRWIRFNGELQKTISKGGIPDKYYLSTNIPNPFNPITSIRYDLPEESMVVITIYDLLGREVRILVNNMENAGFKSLTWDGKDGRGQVLPSGMYIYKLDAVSLESKKEYHQTRKMVLLR